MNKLIEEKLSRANGRWSLTEDARRQLSCNSCEMCATSKQQALSHQDAEHQFSDRCIAAALGSVDFLGETRSKLHHVLVLATKRPWKRLVGKTEVT